MTCEQAKTLIGPLLDGELDPNSTASLQAHLAECPACLQISENYSHLSRSIRLDVGAFQAPDRLRQPRADTKVRVFLASRRNFGLGFGIGVAAAVIAFALFWPRPLTPSLTQALVSDHVRSLMANHLMDVVSTNQHTVKPWFLGKLDFSPPVPNFETRGFPLLGGRLDYVDGRPAAGLVYRRDKHIINVLIVKGSVPSAPEANLNGYHVIHWESGGLTFWAVSDVELSQLTAFVTFFRSNR